MTSVAIATKREAGAHILAAVEKREPELLALAGRGAEAQQFYASLKLYFARNEKILECSPGSVAVAMLKVAETGLRLGTTCDILPFGGEAQFNTRYQGLIQLALASGVRSINADIVRQGDFFEYQKGTEFFLRHRADAPDTAPITHAYAIAELKPGSFVFEVRSRSEIEKLRRKFSKQWAKGELEDLPWYAKKTMVRRLAPYLPQNPRFAAALAFEEKEEADIPAAEFEIQPARVDENGEEVGA